MEIRSHTPNEGSTNAAEHPVEPPMLCDQMVDIGTAFVIVAHDLASHLNGGLGPR